ncbi:MAG TPA: DUF4359 domain-containing protein [Rhodothermales bacterium]
MKAGLIVLVLAVIALALFNPDMEDFQLFVETSAEELIREEVGEGLLSDALSTLGSGLIGDHVDEITTRRNYIIFSTYTIDLDQEPESGDEWRFLGMAGQFLVLDRPE